MSSRIASPKNLAKIDVLQLNYLKKKIKITKIFDEQDILRANVKHSSLIWLLTPKYW